MQKPVVDFDDVPAALPALEVLHNPLSQSFSHITTIGASFSEIFLFSLATLACPVQEPETYAVEFSSKMIHFPLLASWGRGESQCELRQKVVQLNCRPPRLSKS